MVKILMDCVYCDVFEFERDESIEARWPCEQSICKYYPKGIPGEIIADAAANCPHYKQISIEESEAKRKRLEKERADKKKKE